MISSFVYRKGLLEFNWSFSAAVGLFNSVINFSFLIAANWISPEAAGYQPMVKPSLYARSAGEQLFDVVNCVLMIGLSLLTAYPLLYVLFASLSEPSGSSPTPGCCCARSDSRSAPTAWCSRTPTSSAATPTP